MAHYHSHNRLDILARAMDKSHDTEHRIDPRWRGEEAAVADEEALHAVDFAMFIGNACFRVGSHAAGTHLVGGEHHDAVGFHAVLLDLAIKGAQLLFSNLTVRRAVYARALAL